MSELLIHPDREAWANAVADAAAAAISDALVERGAAFAALAGGATPAAILPRLFARPLDWAQVRLTVSDERVVPEGDALSNVGQLRRLAAGTRAEGARIVPLAITSPRTCSGAGLASTTGGEESWVPGQARDDEGFMFETLDLLWAGVGEDGHTLSWFPGPDLQTAYADPAPVIALRPDPLPANAPVQRLTLTLAAARTARTIILAATGEAKRAILEVPGNLPVARLLALPQTVIHWAP